MEIRGDYPLVATVIRDEVYDTLDMDFWKESVHFISKKFEATHRTIVVFKTCVGAKNPLASPYKWFSYKSEMPDDGKYDDNCSCGPNCCNFLINFYIDLRRIDPVIVPDVTSELLFKYQNLI